MSLNQTPTQTTRRHNNNLTQETEMLYSSVCLTPKSSLESAESNGRAVIINVTHRSPIASHEPCATNDSHRGFRPGWLVGWEQVERPYHRCGPWVTGQVQPSARAPAPHELPLLLLTFQFLDFGTVRASRAPFPLSHSRDVAKFIDKPFATITESFQFILKN